MKELQSNMLSLHGARPFPAREAGFAKNFLPREKGGSTQVAGQADVWPEPCGFVSVPPCLLLPKFLDKKRSQGSDTTRLIVQTAKNSC